MKTVERHKKTDFGDVWYVNAVDGTYRFAVYKYDDDDDTLYLSNVFVKEDSRRHGYGNEILASAEEYAKRFGAKVICLKVLSGSDVHRWYKRHGYEDLEKDEEERGYVWMKKELGLNESTWNDIRRQSAGAQERKEEDILTDDEKESFKNWHIKGFAKEIVFKEKYKNNIDDFKDYISNRITYQVGTKDMKERMRKYIWYGEKNWTTGEKFSDVIDGWIDTFNKEVDDTGFVREPGVTIDDTLNNWWTSLDINYKVDVVDWATGGDEHYKRDPDDWWDDLSYIERIKEYMEDKKMNESTWNDIRKQSAGTAVRNEDDINMMDYPEFYEYLKDTYESQDPSDFFNIGQYPTSGTQIRNISIPIEQNDPEETPNLANRMFTICYDLGKKKFLTLRPNEYFFRLYPNEIQKVFGDKYDIDVNKRTISPKDGEITNRVCIDVLDKLLSIVERPMVVKNIQESVWDSIRKQSAGVDARDEDVLSDERINALRKIYPKGFSISHVYFDKYENSLEGMKDYLKTHKDQPDYAAMIKYLVNNWTDGDNLSKVVKDQIDDRKKDMYVYGFKKEPGKTVHETLWDWFASLDIDMMKLVIKDCNTREIVLDEKDTLDGMSKDELKEIFDGVSWRNSFRTYVKYHNKTNESVWNDIRRQSSGNQERMEDMMNEDDLDALNDFIVGFSSRVVWDGMRDSLTNFLKYIDENPEALDCDIEKIKKHVENNWYKGICDDVEASIEREEKEKEQGMNDDGLDENCEGVPGGATPASVGGMGAAYFPGPNGEPGSGDLPMPSGHVYRQVAPFGLFIKARKNKGKKKKKFRKEDEPCSHSPNAKVYDYVDDYREYVDRIYDIVDRRK